MNDEKNEQTTTIIQKEGKLFINGKEISQPRSLFFRDTIVCCDGKIYINGKVFKNGKWQYTIKSIFFTLF